MGAVTALLHQAREASPRNPSWGEAPPPIKHTTNAMVLDSPFADFCQLAEELVAKGRERGVVVPTVVTRLALSMLGTSVQSQAGFDIRDLSAIREVPRCRLPALFVCAKMDDFIGALAASHVGAFTSIRLVSISP